jgi:hypothetical protein
VTNACCSGLRCVNASLLNCTSSDPSCTCSTTLN